MEVGVFKGFEMNPTRPPAGIDIDIGIAIEEGFEGGEDLFT